MGSATNTTSSDKGAAPPRRNGAAGAGTPAKSGQADLLRLEAAPQSYGVRDTALKDSEIDGTALVRALSTVIPFVDDQSTMSRMRHLRITLSKGRLEAIGASVHALGEAAVVTRYSGARVTAYMSVDIAQQMVRAIKAARPGTADHVLTVATKGSGESAALVFELRDQAGAEQTWRAPLKVEWIEHIEDQWKRASGTPALAEGSIAVSPKILKLFFHATEALAPSRGNPAMLQFHFFGPLDPVLVRIAPGFRGLCMPVRVPDIAPEGRRA